MSSSNFAKRKGTLEKQNLASAKDLKQLFVTKHVPDNGMVGPFLIFRTQRKNGLVTCVHTDDKNAVIFSSGEKTSIANIYVVALDIPDLPVRQKAKSRSNEVVRAVTQDYKTKLQEYRVLVLEKSREARPVVRDVIERDEQHDELISALKLKKSLLGSLCSSLKKQPLKNSQRHKSLTEDISGIDDGGPISYEKVITPGEMLEDRVPSFESLSVLFHEKGLSIGDVRCASVGAHGELLLLRFVTGKKLFGRMLWVQGDDVPTWLVPNGYGMRDATSVEKFTMMEMIKMAVEKMGAVFVN